MSREIILDVETTGRSHNAGDRIVEVACLELINGRERGKSFHTFVNPCREVGYSYNIHGISDEFLSDKSKFEDIAKDLQEFLGNDKIVAHNANFDIGFLNSEFKRIGLAEIDSSRAVDTLQLARTKVPGRSCHKIDDLIVYFGLDLARDKHSALEDVHILFQIYLRLTIDPQPKISFNHKSTMRTNRKTEYRVITSKNSEIKTHEELMISFETGKETST